MGVNKANLQDAYDHWLKTDHPNRPGNFNQDRSSSDLLNFERSLRCIAASAGYESDDLRRAPLALLEVSETLLVDRVGNGCRVLAEQKGRSVSKKTISNLVSCAKAVRSTVFESYERPVRERGPIQLLRDKPKHRSRPKFYQKAWPERIKREFADYRTWKLKPILDPSEEEYRRSPCRPVTIDGRHALSLNPYVGYMVQIESATNFGLVDLCDTQRFSNYIEWRLGQEFTGGYHVLAGTATTLATVTQYLVAKSSMPLTDAEKKPWDRFYDLKRRILRLGASRGEISAPSDVGSWRPDDLRRLGLQAWETDPVRSGSTSHTLYESSIFLRRRVGTIFFLSPETPLRARNWIEMKWGKNLIREPDGRWRVRFVGEELKISNRGYVPNVYEHTYSLAASRMVDRYRAFVVSRLGSDFEQRTPNVFMPNNPGKGRCGEQLTLYGIARGMNLLVLELRGETFHPHKMRHIVGSFLVNEYGAKGLGLAAKLLGDTPEMVLKNYYRPKAERDLEDYFMILNP